MLLLTSPHKHAHLSSQARRQPTREERTRLRSGLGKGKREEIQVMGEVCLRAPLPPAVQISRDSRFSSFPFGRGRKKSHPTGEGSGRRGYVLPEAGQVQRSPPSPTGAGEVGRAPPAEPSRAGVWRSLFGRRWHFSPWGTKREAEPELAGWAPHFTPATGI